MRNDPKKPINAFSNHLFWDTQKQQVDLVKNQTWLVTRVLEKGLLSDWKLLLQILGKQKIRESVLQTRHLKKRAKAFACNYLNLDPGTLRCSTQKSSQNTPWNSKKPLSRPPQLSDLPLLKT